MPAPMQREPDPIPRWIPPVTRDLPDGKYYDPERDIRDYVRDCPTKKKPTVH